MEDGAGGIARPDTQPEARAVLGRLRDSVGEGEGVGAGEVEGWVEG